MRRVRVWATALAAGVLACEQAPPTASEEFTVPVVVMRAFNSTSSTQNSGASLSGNDEVPPNASPGRGEARFKLSDDGTSMHYKLNVANIDQVTQSHIHIAAPGVNGPIVVFLFGFVSAGVSVNGTLAEGTITAANLIARPAIGFGATMPELVAAMRAGNAYVNVHTIPLPGGEIRGQIR